MVFGVAGYENEVKMKIQDGPEENFWFSVIVMGVVFMVFGVAGYETEVKMKIQDGARENFWLLSHGCRFHGLLDHW